MDTTTFFNKSESSVALSKNAKGGYTWEIKVYDSDIEQAIEKVKKANEKMLGLYPQS